MPLEKLELADKSAWALWKMNEEEHDLVRQVAPYEDIPADITNARKRLEWITGRVVVKTIMEVLKLPFQGIVKDDFGKPFPKNCSYQLSLSHSFPYVAAYLHPDESIGIDLEQPKRNLLRIASRILDAEELEDAGYHLGKHCIYWCAKEVLVKVYGKKDLIFGKNLKISPFSLSQSGHLVGRLIVPTRAEITVPMYYEVHPDFTVVLNRPSKK